MPARVVLVHDRIERAEHRATVLREAGFECVCFTKPLEALAALEHARHIELLITKGRFPKGNPNGASLALMAKSQCPKVRVLFTTTEEFRDAVSDIGELLVVPASDDQFLAAVRAMIDETADRKSA